MNTNILQKCVDALKEKDPDLSYVRGMLETLIEMGDTQSAQQTFPAPQATAQVRPLTSTEDAGLRIVS